MGTGGNSLGMCSHYLILFPPRLCLVGTEEPSNGAGCRGLFSRSHCSHCFLSWVCAGAHANSKKNLMASIVFSLAGLFFCVAIIWAF